MTTTLITNYHNTTGEHCGSQSMRDLLRHYCDLDLPEAAVFGLGSGIDCIYLDCEQFNPARVLFGRSLTLETDLTGALGVDYQETIELDEEKAWDLVRQEVVEGRPTMLSGDVFYLDYRRFKVHFPGHRFVLVGFDDEKKLAYVADRIAPEIQAASYGALARSRNPPEGMSTYNLWGRFHDTRVTHSLEEACAIALGRSVDRMLGRDRSQFELLSATSGAVDIEIATGIDALTAFAGSVTGWGEREDAAFLASYASQVVEKFGSGGGNFRKIYTEFLRWARGLRADLVPEVAIDLAARSAGRWTALAGTFEEASKNPAEKSHWVLAAEQAREIQRIERDLFETLDVKTAAA